MHVGIFHTAFVGDLALLGLLIEGLHRSGHKVTLFTNAAGIQLFKDDDRVASCVLIQKGKGLQKAKSVLENASKISSASLDTLLVPHRSATSAIISRLSGVKKTVAHKDSTLAKLYSETRPRDLTQHEVIRVLDLAPDWLIAASLKKELKALGRSVLNARPQPQAVLTTNPDLFSDEHPYIMIAPGSVWGTKIYPPEKYALVISNLLSKHPSLRCVVSGGPSDRAAITGFLHALTVNDTSRVINTMGRISLGELITVTAHAKAVLTNDSAPVHIASGTNTPTVAVFGPTIRENGFWPTADRSVLINYTTEHGAPLPCQPCGIHGPQVCPLGHHKCMKEISSSVIEAAVERILVTL